MKLPTKTILIVALAAACSYFFYGLYNFILSKQFFISHEWQLKNYIMLAIYIVWGSALTKILNNLFKDIENAHPNNKEVKNHLIPFLSVSSKILIVLTIISLALNDWQVELAPLIASAGVIGVAIAFAAKDIVANFFGGISVFFDKPYKVGDYVIIDEKYRGEVIQIGMRSTKIKTRDNILITIPNSVMVTNAVINETGLDPILRVRIPIQVSYRSNLDLVEKIILEVVSAHEQVIKEPPVKVRYREFAESGISLEALANIIDPANRGLLVHELIKDLHAEFGKRGIEVPYPRRDIYIMNENIANVADLPKVHTPISRTTSGHSKLKRLSTENKEAITNLL